MRTLNCRDSELKSSYVTRTALSLPNVVSATAGLSLEGTVGPQLKAARTYTFQFSHNVARFTSGEIQGR